MPSTWKTPGEKPLDQEMTATKNATKVMLVDDNPIILELLQEGIEPLAETSAFHDPVVALAHCFEGLPDLVICDYRMPGLDGLELIQKLKARPGGDTMRVMVMAAKADIDEKLRPIADMVEEFVVKPFFVKDLAGRAKKVLDRIYWEKM